MKPKYWDNMRMVNTDTDSFVFHAKTDDIYICIYIYIFIYIDLRDINEEMDFSGYD